MPRRHSGSDWHHLTFYPPAQMRLVGGFAACLIPLVAQSELAGGRPDRCQRQSLISCAATLGRSGPTTAGAGHPGTANAGDGALPGLAMSAAGQPTFCAPRLSHTWVDTMQIAAVDTNNSSAAMW